MVALQKYNHCIEVIVFEYGLSIFLLKIQREWFAVQQRKLLYLPSRIAQLQNQAEVIRQSFSGEIKTVTNEISSETAFMEIISALMQSVRWKNMKLQYANMSSR